ncbi:MAG: universal stress protein [Chitinophagaceae bacterium]|nr:universal stress protein [Chitinophagaceae bacterium]
MLLIHSVKSDNYEEDIKNAEARLEIIGKTITESEGVKIDTKVYFGPTENSIRIATSENNIDMVIMGTLGNTAFVEKVFGSITASVIGKTIVPLLAIPLLSDWKTPKRFC